MRNYPSSNRPDILFPPCPPRRYFRSSRPHGAGTMRYPARRPSPPLIDMRHVEEVHKHSKYARRVSLPNCPAERPRVMPRGGYVHRDVSLMGRGPRMSANFSGGDMGRWERW